MWPCWPVWTTLSHCCLHCRHGDVWNSLSQGSERDPSQSKGTQKSNEPFHLNWPIYSENIKGVGWYNFITEGVDHPKIKKKTKKKHIQCLLKPSDNLCEQQCEIQVVINGKFYPSLYLLILIWTCITYCIYGHFGVYMGQCSGEDQKIRGIMQVETGSMWYKHEVNKKIIVQYRQHCFSKVVLARVRC